MVPCCLQAAGASRLQRLDDACDERRREQRRRTAALTVKLRDWQREALAKWREADRGVVAVVTGGGKTWFALACTLDLLRRRPDTLVVIVVPTVALLDQWVVVLTDDSWECAEDIAMFGGRRHRPDRAYFNVMVLNTARRVTPEIASSRPTFLIVDECHRAASMHNALSLRGSHVATLGLSATPEQVSTTFSTTLWYRYSGPSSIVTTTSGARRTCHYAIRSH